MTRRRKVLAWIGGSMLACSAIGAVALADVRYATETTRDVIASTTAHHDAVAERVAQLSPVLVATRIDLDRGVIAAVESVQARLDDRLCPAARGAVGSDSAMPQVDVAVKAEIAAAPRRSPVLTEVPGWERRLNVSALSDRMNGCAEEARAERARAAATRTKANKGSGGNRIPASDRCYQASGKQIRCSDIPPGEFVPWD